MTRIARTALSMLASVALITPNVAMAQASNAQFSHEEIMQCYKASAVYFIFSKDDDLEAQDMASEQIEFWLDQMDPNMAAFDAELDAFGEETAAAVKAPDVDTVAAGYLTKWADTYDACTNKSGGQVVRKIDSPAMEAVYSRDESIKCVFSVIPLYFVAKRDNWPNLDALAASGGFWTTQLEMTGKPSAELEQELMARLDTIEADFAAAKTPEQTAEFLAPVATDFAACEAKMKAVTGA